MFDLLLLFDLLLALLSLRFGGLAALFRVRGGLFAGGPVLLCIAR